jgi:hypothetical protein
MPVRPVKRMGRDGHYRLVGFMWGHHGKLYTIRRWGKEGAHNKASRQGMAVKVSQTRRSDKWEWFGKGKKKVRCPVCHQLYWRKHTCQQLKPANVTLRRKWKKEPKPEDANLRRWHHFETEARTKIKMIPVNMIEPTELEPDYVGQGKSMKLVDKYEKMNPDTAPPIEVINTMVGKKEIYEPNEKSEDNLGFGIIGNPKKYLLTDGHHRYLAALKRGDEMIPAKIIDMPIKTKEWRKSKGLHA